MLPETQIKEIVTALNSLPDEKVEEARDFVLFLQNRYGRKTDIDENDAWSDEDLRDAAAASLAYSETHSKDESEL
jgi:hypothetical protein